MKKTDLEKNKGLALVNKLKNASKNSRIPDPGKAKKKHFDSNPLVASLIKKGEFK